MKLLYQRLTAGSDEGFTLKRIRGRDFTCPWHFHPEHELVLTLRCPGYRMVGDDITPLKNGDLVLLGAKLPHIWQYDRSAPADVLLLQFEDDFLGAGCLDLPALEPVKRLLRHASLGLQFGAGTRERAAALMERMERATGLKRVVLFLSVLETLASSRSARPIASPGFTADRNPFNQERMNSVFQFIERNLAEPLRLANAARVAHLSEGAFSRFLRLHTGRTFPALMNQLRVGRACRLLAETETPVLEVALSCGFQNLSNFNRQFLRLKRVSPRAFRRTVQRGAPGAAS